MQLTIILPSADIESTATGTFDNVRDAAAWIGETCRAQGDLHGIAVQTPGHPAALGAALLSPLLYDVLASYYDDLACTKRLVELLLEGYELALRYTPRGAEDVFLADE